MEMTEQFERTAREIEAKVKPQIEDAKRKIEDLNDQVTTYIKANPGKCLLGAIAAGFIIGRIARR
jgi:phage host-nuclease inhibitor protein Gam